jgi:hypothetical protein
MNVTNHYQRELEREFRVANMLVTMHSDLRDIYHRKAIILDSTIFGLSIAVTSLAFFDPEFLRWLPWSSQGSRLAIGLIGVLVFLLSFLALRVDWKGKSEAHRIAAQAYFQVKSDCSYQLSRLDTITPEEFQRIFSRYGEIGQTHIQIPESKFLYLKGRHYTKIEISRILDQYPASSLRLLKARLWLNHTWSALARLKQEGRSSVPAGDSDITNRGVQ